MHRHPTPRPVRTIVGRCLVAAALAAVAGSPAVAALDWSSFLGGGDGDSIAAVDLAGDGVVVVGTTTSDDFPVTADAVATSRDPGGDFGRDAFLARLTAGATDVAYGTYLGGSGEDLGVRVAVAPDGTYVLLGQTDSTDLPVTGPAPYPALTGGIDTFVARIDPATGGLVWLTYYGGTGGDFPRDLILAPDGAIVVLGDTGSTDLPVGDVGADATLDGARDMFVARFGADGGFEGARYLGGSGDEFGGGVRLGPDGDVWIAGRTDSEDFPGAATGPAGGTDAVIVRLAADLSDVRMTSLVGGSGDDRARDVAVAADGASVVAFGTTPSADFPTTAGAIRSTPRGRDLFVLRVDAATGDLQASTLFGSQGGDTAFRVATDASGAVVLTGSGLQGGAATTPGAADPEGKPACTPYCFTDALVARLNTTLTRVQYATWLASSNGDEARSVAGTVRPHVVGAASEDDFPVTSGTVGTTINRGGSSAASDGFVTRLDLTASAPRLRVGREALAWDPLPHADGYDVVRGDLTALREDGAATERAVLGCVADSTVSTTVATGPDPGPGEAWWYVVRAERADTPTSYDVVGTTQRGTRDDGVDAAAAACPGP